MLRLGLEAVSSLAATAATATHSRAKTSFAIVGGLLRRERCFEREVNGLYGGGLAIAAVGDWRLLREHLNRLAGGGCETPPLS